MKSSALELTMLEYAFKRRAFGREYLIGCMLSHDLISHISVPGYSETQSHCNYFSQNGGRGRGETKSGRYKEYLCHHNPYRVEVARTRHRGRNS